MFLPVGSLNMPLGCHDTDTFGSPCIILCTQKEFPLMPKQGNGNEANMSYLGLWIGLRSINKLQIISMTTSKRCNNQYSNAEACGPPRMVYYNRYSNSFGVFSYSRFCITFVKSPLFNIFTGG